MPTLLPGLPALKTGAPTTTTGAKATAGTGLFAAALAALTTTDGQRPTAPQPTGPQQGHAGILTGLPGTSTGLGAPLPAENASQEHDEKTAAADAVQVAPPLLQQAVQVLPLPVPATGPEPAAVPAGTTAAGQPAKAPLAAAPATGQVQATFVPAVAAVALSGMKTAPSKTAAPVGAAEAVSLHEAGNTPAGPAPKSAAVPSAPVAQAPAQLTPPPAAEGTASVQTVGPSIAVPGLSASPAATSVAAAGPALQVPVALKAAAGRDPQPKPGEARQAAPTDAPTFSLPAPQAPAPASTAPVQAAPTPAPVPFAAQLSKPVFTLATAAPGEHVLTVKVTPENLGPVTVQAHISADGVKVQLYAPTDAGRAAVQDVLPDLRRDLAAAGLGASLDLSDRQAPQERGGQGSGQQPARRTPAVTGVSAVRTPSLPVAVLAAGSDTSLDILA